MTRKAHSGDLILGIDLGGTKIAVGVANPAGELLAYHTRGTPAQQGVEAVIKAILQAAWHVLKEASIGPSRLTSIGVGAPGTVKPDTGVVTTSPHLPGWQDVPLKTVIEGEFKVKSFVGNDANAAALGELYFGAGRSVRNLIYVTVSTGIGGGIIIDGKLYTGASGVAGEVGHMTIAADGPRCDCGRIGCWEALASGTALAREARLRIKGGARTTILAHAGGNPEQISARSVHDAAREGDALAQKLIAQTGYYLGVGFANLVNIFNPERILIGGGLANMGDLLLKPALAVVEAAAFPVAVAAVRFVPAQLGSQAGVLGAVALAL